MTSPKLVLLTAGSDEGPEALGTNEPRRAGLDAFGQAGASAVLQRLDAIEAYLRQLDRRLALLDPAATAADIASTVRRHRMTATAQRRLVVDEACLWFQPPDALDAERVDLGKRHALRRVFGALVDAREQSPGRELSCAALLAAGWPNERVLQQAGSARVRSAIAELRRLGLRDVLAKGEHGYLLDVRVLLERAPRD